MPNMPNPEVQEPIARLNRAIETKPSNVKDGLMRFKSYCSSYSPATYRMYMRIILNYIRFLENTNGINENNNDNQYALLEAIYRAGNTNTIKQQIMSYKEYLDGKNFESSDRPNKRSASRYMIIALKRYYKAVYGVDIVPYGETTRRQFGLADAYRGEIDLITDREFDRLVEYSPNSLWRAIVYMLGTSGLRVGELCNLKNKDLFWEENRVHVEYGKRGVERSTLFSVKCQELVRVYFAEREVLKAPTDYVFWADLEKRRRVTQPFVYFGLLGIGKRAIIQRRLYPHLLRHYAFTKLARNDVPMKTIQKLAGHVNLNTTGLYVELSEKETQDFFQHSTIK